MQLNDAMADNRVIIRSLVYYHTLSDKNIVIVSDFIAGIIMFLMKRIEII